MQNGSEDLVDPQNMPNKFFEIKINFTILQIINFVFIYDFQIRQNITIFE